MTPPADEMARFAALEQGAALSVCRAAAVGDRARGGTFAAWAAAELLSLIGAVAPGADCRAQSLSFEGTPDPGDTLTFTVTVGGHDEQRRTVTLDCVALDAGGRRVLAGTVTLRHPVRLATSTVLDRRNLAPDVVFHNHRRYEQLIASCRSRDPLRAAVVHPVEATALTAVVEATEAGLISPTLVGPAGLMRRAADAAGVDISAWPVVDVPTDVAAAAAGVRLARDGQAQALMKGSLHSATLLHAVLSGDAGLRGSGWISHVFVFDVATYPKPLLVSDAVIAIAPTLEQKAGICRNAIAVAHALGIARPKVALLSATEDVDPAIPSTLDAAALCKMADRGQISGAILDGPLAMDNAISTASATTKGIISPVAGQADILIVPNLEAGNILYKNLTYLAGADAAGVVVGATVPIILASRADSVRTRIASAALASLLAAGG
jgi:phosphate acetyltransferase